MIDLLSAAAGAEAPPFYISLLPWVGILAIFWFLLIRPQMRQQKEHRDRISALKKGDQVVTSGGIVGKIVRVDDVYADVVIAQGVRVKTVKATIGEIIPPGGTAAND